MWDHRKGLLTVTGGADPGQAAASVWSELLQSVVYANHAAAAAPPSAGHITVQVLTPWGDSAPLSVRFSVRPLHGAAGPPSLGLKMGAAPVVQWTRGAPPAPLGDCIFLLGNGLTPFYAPFFPDVASFCSWEMAQLMNTSLEKNVFAGSDLRVQDYCTRSCAHALGDNCSSESVGIAALPHQGKTDPKQKD